MTQDPVRVEELTRYHGTACSLDGLSFEVPAGSVTALVGRNGAGKSTALRLILGLDRATRGRAFLFGCDSAGLGPDQRARIGYVAEGHPLPGRDRVVDCRRFEAAVHPNWSDELCSAVLEHFRVDSAQRVRDLSRGQRAGLSIALALSSGPELLVLDDPCLGLDPVARQAVLESLVHVVEQGGRTILLSSHLVDDVERLADRLVILDRGLLRASCDVETFRRSVRRFLVPADQAEALAAHPGLLRLDARGDQVVASLVLGEGESLPVDAAHEEPPSLEQALQAYLGERGPRRSFFDQVGGAA